VIIGENRTFDNVYAIYVPKHGTVTNLLSKGIIYADGTPGPNADLAAQFQLQTINPVSWYQARASGQELTADSLPSRQFPAADSGL
jgi:phospholipase C